MKKLVLPLLLSIFAGCGKFSTDRQFKVFEKDATPTSTRIDTTNPYTIQFPETGGVSKDDFEVKPSASLVMGFLSVKGARIGFDEKTNILRIAGTLVKKDQAGKTSWERHLEMTGTLSEDGFVNVMKPSNGSDADLIANLRGRGMCFEDLGHPCTHAVVELVYRDGENSAHGLQLETDEPLFTPPPPKPAVKPPTTTTTIPQKPVPGKPAPKPAPTPAPTPAPKEQPVEQEEILDEDATLQPDLYIGTLHEDWRKLYTDEASQSPKPKANPPAPEKKEEPKTGVTTTTTTTTTTTIPGQQGSTPVPPPPAPAPEPTPETKPASPAEERPYNQAIGPSSTEINKQTGKKLSGSLKDGTYLITENNKSPSEKKLNLYLPGDDHLYGTWELVQLLKSMGIYAIDLKIPLYVGDLAKKGGGVVAPHVSHQNGLDVDVGYPFENAAKYGGTPDTVNAKGQVVPGLKVKEMYDLFKYAYSTGAMNLIFVHPGIKKLLCNEAESRNELSADGKSGTALPFMSKLRPEPNHDKHFHIRINCSKYQPKCRTTTEPDSKISGC